MPPQRDAEIQGVPGGRFGGGDGAHVEALAHARRQGGRERRGCVPRAEPHPVARPDEFHRALGCRHILAPARIIVPSSLQPEFRGSYPGNSSLFTLSGSAPIAVTRLPIASTNLAGPAM